jgi:hypothetical protein
VEHNQRVRMVRPWVVVVVGRREEHKERPWEVVAVVRKEEHRELRGEEEAHTEQVGHNRQLVVVVEVVVPQDQSLIPPLRLQLQALGWRLAVVVDRVWVVAEWGLLA